MLKRTLVKLFGPGMSYSVLQEGDRSDIPDLKKLPDVVVPRYEAGTKRSLLRSLVPFTVLNTIGSTSAATRAGFQRYPQLINQVFDEIGSLSTLDGPRAELADAFQALLEGETRQSEVRQLFEAAAISLNNELVGDLEDSVHARDDPLYRLHLHELHLAAGFYARYFATHPAPLEIALRYLTLAYQTDIQKDSCIKAAVLVLEHFTSRGELTEEYNNLFAEIAMMERDIMGPWRFDRRGGLQLLFHCLQLDLLGRTRDTAEVMYVPVLRQYLNITRTEVAKHAGRWNDVILTPAAEDWRAWKRGTGNGSGSSSGQSGSENIISANGIDFEVFSSTTAAVGVKPNPSPVLAGVTPFSRVNPKMLRSSVSSQETSNSSGAAADGSGEDEYEDLPTEDIKVEVPELLVIDKRTPPARIAYNRQLGWRTTDPVEIKDVAHFDLPILSEPVGFLDKWFKRPYFNPF